MSSFADFLSGYRKAAAARDKAGIPPLPLTAAQVASLCACLENAGLSAQEGAEAAALLAQRVTPGVTPAAEAKAAWLSKAAA